MPFPGGGLDCAENNKQHLNLSVEAYEVIQNDMFTFGEEKLSGFLNTIFEHYSPAAEASIARTLHSLQEELEKSLSGISCDETAKDRIIKRLLDREKDRLLEKALSYEKGRPFKFWLNKRNLTYLTEPESECEEEKYYGDHRGRYIKSVIEEYARLPYVRRELVYFSLYVKEIQYAIREKRQLRIVTGSDRKYSVFPYAILCDPLFTANYLVGYSKRYSHPEDEEYPCSFRISALRSVRVEKSKSAFLKESRQTQLNRIIATRGVQFMASGEEEILVRLTEEGEVKYRRQLNLRPAFVEKRDGGVFVFRCTPAQAEFYFFKFGKDAEILQPASLREKVALMYKCASDVYKNR